MHLRMPVLLLSLLTSACALTTHAVQPGTLGVPRSTAELLAVVDQPGTVTVETVASCDWEVDRSGLINLDNPVAREAHLVDGPEPIQVFFHVLRHPTRGTFLVDTGVERALRDHPDQAAIRGIVASFMKLEKMKFNAPLGDWLAAHPEKVEGIFLTHLHLDHVSGLPDAPLDTPLYAGPGEAREHSWVNAILAPNIDRALAGRPALQEWPYTPDASGRFRGVIDVFGDGSVWALWVPGHTAGSTAYLVRTPTGPVLLTGDASHTRWGWEHDVEPGSFSADRPASVTSLAHLKQLVADHPSIEVRFGHQR